MRKSLILLAAVAPIAMGLFGGSAHADENAAPHSPEAISSAAHQMVSRLRHRWDEARTKDPALASCLETRVMQAISVAKRVDEHRFALRDVADPKERARRLVAIERLGERRVEISNEALACEGHPSFSAPLAFTEVVAKTSPNIASVDPEATSEGFPPNVLWALLRLR